MCIRDRTYLAEEYPELAGTAEELHEILTTVLDAEHRATVSKSTDNHIYDSVTNNFENHTYSNVQDSGIGGTVTSQNSTIVDSHITLNTSTQLNTTQTVNFDISLETINNQKGTEFLENIKEEESPIKTKHLIKPANRDLEISYSKFAENLQLNKYYFSRGSESRKPFRKSRLGTIQKSKTYIEKVRSGTVSYTHLTLPTIYSV